MSCFCQLSGQFARGNLSSTSNGNVDIFCHNYSIIMIFEIILFSGRRIYNSSSAEIYRKLRLWRWLINANFLLDVIHELLSFLECISVSFKVKYIHQQLLNVVRLVHTERSILRVTYYWGLSQYFIHNLGVMMLFHVLRHMSALKPQFDKTLEVSFSFSFLLLHYSFNFRIVKL